MSAASPASLSVVIPAYNEQARLGETLKSVVAWLAVSGRDGEVVVVDDGSSDDTAGVVRAAARVAPVPVILAQQPRNLGKGAAVRLGVERATGAIVLISDADLSTPIEEAPKLLAALAEGAAIAIGSRALPGSRVEIHQAWYREGMGRAFNLLVRLVSGMPFRDTQCGFKAIGSALARDLFGRQRITGFGFDVEVLFLALRGGHRVAEVPVTWRNSPHSRVNPVVDSLRMARDVLLVRMRYARGQYRRGEE